MKTYYSNKPPTTFMKVPFVDLKTQYHAICDEIKREMEEVFEDCGFILGNKVRAFENEFARYCGCRFGIGVASGTDAILLCLKALGIGRGDEVITQANTFIATLLAIHYSGAKPVLVDIDPETYTMDTMGLSEAITERTKAIIPVHMYGRSAHMDEIKRIASKYNLYVVEDACQSHGAIYYGSTVRRTGGIGDMGCFSFYPGKNLGAYGDGGMIVTDNEELAEKVCMLRDYGQERKYRHVLKGFNSRLDSLQAAVLMVKLRYLDGWNNLRFKHAELYSKLLKDIPEVRLPRFEKKDFSHVFHLFVVRTEKRDFLINYLKERGITTGIHYPVPCHMQEAFKELGYKKGDFPITESYSEKVLSLPMYPEITEDKIEYVSDAIREFYGY